MVLVDHGALQRLAALIGGHDGRAGSLLALDATGAIGGMTDLLIGQGFDYRVLAPVTITGGDHVTEGADRTMRVPKRKGLLCRLRLFLGRPNGKSTASSARRKGGLSIGRLGRDGGDGIELPVYSHVADLSLIRNAAQGDHGPILRHSCASRAEWAPPTVVIQILLRPAVET
jgi:hypothetical protein